MSSSESAEARVVKLPRMLKSDIRPMERCCGHHLLAHDAFGCLITGCVCGQQTAQDDRSAMLRDTHATAAAGS